MRLTTATALITAFAIIPSVVFAAKGNDEAFIRSALIAGNAEIESASIQTDSSDSYVHDFANKMITDHRSADNALLALSASLGVKAPPYVQPAAEQQPSPAAVNPNAEQVPRSQPVEYFKHEIADHKRAIAMFQQEASSGTNARVRAFAQQTLPTLHEHLALAEKYLKIEKSLHAQ